MTGFDERDLAVVKWIQELKGCTVARAKEYFRQTATALADPDHQNRAELVLENIQRGTKITKAKPPKEKKEMATKKAKKVAEKPDKVEAAARPTVELAELSREVMLTPAGEGSPHVYTANLFGKKHAVILAEIDHSKGVEDRFGYIPVSIPKLKNAASYAADNGKLPLAICATVRVKGRVDQGYAVPREVFEKFILKSKHAMTLSGKARLAYRENGWEGCKFTVAKPDADSKAA